MNGIIINTIAISIVIIAAGRTHLIIKHPSRFIVSLDRRLHQQRTAQDVSHVTIQTLYVLRSVGKTHSILIRVRINNTGAEVDELRLHRVVHTGSETLIVRACALQSSFLVIIVKTYIIGIMCTATAQVDIVILTSTSLEYLLEPIGIGVVHELISAITNCTIATRKRCTRVSGCLTKISTVLISIHHVIFTLANLINTEVTFIIYFQRLIFLTTLSSNDNHTVSSTRTIDSTRRSIFQHLDGLNVIRREVADSCTHRHTIDHIQRSGTTKRADTTDSDSRIGTGLTI